MTTAGHPEGIEVLIIISSGGIIKVGEVHTTGKAHPKGTRAFEILRQRTGKLEMACQELIDVPVDGSLLQGSDAPPTLYQSHPCAWMIPYRELDEPTTTKQKTLETENV